MVGSENVLSVLELLRVLTSFLLPLYAEIEMSSEEARSVVGSEVMPLEYGGMDSETSSSPTSSERTVEDRRGQRVVEEEEDEIPSNILEAGNGIDGCYDPYLEIVSEVRGYVSELGSRESLRGLVVCCCYHRVLSHLGFRLVDLRLAVIAAIDGCRRGRQKQKMMGSRPFDDDGFIGYEPCLPSQRFDSFSNFDVGSVKDSVYDSPPIFSSQSYNSRDDVFVSQPILETPSLLPIRGGSGGFLDFSAEENGNDLDGNVLNLTHFRVNYILLLLPVLFFSLIYHPFSLIILLVILIAWVFLYLAREEPLLLCSYIITDRVVAEALFVKTEIMAGPHHDAVSGHLLASDKVLADFEPVKRPKRNKFAFVCAILASMTSILLGYDIGVMSGAAIYIQKDLKISDVQVEILIGTLSLYSLIGSAAAGRTSDWLGRRYTIVLAGSIFFIGALLMGSATNYAFLMVGRFVAGIGVGYALMIAPVYTAEVSPASTRGFLTSFPEVFINIGVLLGYVSNYAFSKLSTHLGWRMMLGVGAIPSVALAIGVLAMPESPRWLVFINAGGLVGYISNYAFSKLSTHLGWRMMLGVGAIPSVALAIGILAMPESPRWLVMQGRLGEAKRVLNQTSDSKEEAQIKLNNIKEAAGIPLNYDDDIVQVTKRSHGEGVWKELFIYPTPPVRHVLVAAIGIHFFQQASGIESVGLYGPRIFKKAGITSNGHQLLATIAVGFVKTTFILVATFLLDRVGRRPLLLSSVAGVIISLGTLGIGLTIIDHSEKKLTWALVLCILMVLSNVAMFSIGMGPVTWVYSSEIFPLRLRAQGASMGVAVNRVTSGVISMTFISLYKSITIGGAFFLYGGVATVSWIFFYKFLPETQGKTLEEMEGLFGKFNWKGSKEKKENKELEGNGGQVQLGNANGERSA
ncbi:hypothetical protein SLEP1_g29965 [Rubroshorea leprosula]|uniref:Major facilitator superfamily (MFS) profile domain-containing protein n=1 Tax=Rubroshorea leprosula TaxID=152421 RepID=A0AAV5K4Z8_9ROSI|nr:hypothetical protein SLEP1_g29965 [Rubroshorea leprosula]